MNTIQTRSLTLILLILGLYASQAEVRLPAILSSDMVLQRNATVKLWGWADAKEKIEITTSWLESPLVLKADEAGKWLVNVKTTNSKAAQTIRITSAESNILLENILFGEVWLCSGQSNMQQSFKGYQGEPTFYDPIKMLKTDNPDLRMFTVARNAEIGEPVREDLKAYTGWAAANPELVLDFSAVAYYFGQQLQEILDVPVGLIHDSWAGSAIQPWMSEEAMEPFLAVDDYSKALSAKYPRHHRSSLYNAMIHPIVNFSIKGVLWYQGESNRKQPDLYPQFLSALVEDWRAKFGDVPFYYVQIAPYKYDGIDLYDKPDNTAYLREAQLKSLEAIPNSGMAITLDIGEEHTIHPPDKKTVADRLLFNALNQTYDFSTIDFQGPVYDSLTIEGHKVTLSFKHAENGLFAAEELSGFEIAGADRVFYPGKAVISGGRKKVVVSNEKVPNPVAVRYGWSNWIKATLFDTSLLPASSFRTDDWDDATRIEN